jgi:cell division septation protein DedD
VTSVTESNEPGRPAGDDGFREIHLSGKHLVALFIGVTVVGVVIFLCGVMVGRGVRNSTAVNAAVESAPVTGGGGEIAPPADAQAKTVEPPPAQSATPPPVPVEEPVAPPAGDAAKPGQPGQKAEPAASTPTPAASQVANEPAGEGWAVQVTAVRDKGQAEAIVKHLVEKGYAAYVLAPPQNGTAIHRVRIGKFKDRREADQVMRRLEKEEQFKNCFPIRLR